MRFLKKGEFHLNRKYTGPVDRRKENGRLRSYVPVKARDMVSGDRPLVSLEGVLLQLQVRMYRYGQGITVRPQ